MLKLMQKMALQLYVAVERGASPSSGVSGIGDSTISDGGAGESELGGDLREDLGIVLNDGEEMMSLNDLCDALHAISHLASYPHHGGKAMGCFSIKLGEGTAFEAELAACINAVDIASDRGWKKLWLESDCTRVVELLYTDVPEKYEGAWMRALDRLQRMEFRVTHIYREGNRVADALASSNVKTELVSELLYQDTIGCVNLRLR
ncbi:hypothetical protein SASPL_117029 [Salvia splendens]|uniref:RNase H type-1 domain-containing protein n=1 Tax=Salvia splendens TaxID=180675 RepID=A0A8X8XYX7_SALSN|nr:hypothetical protein SASPL_117029 [Salvia splendens]